VAWGTTDAGTGLKSYQVQESYNGGAFKAISLIRPTAGSAARQFTYGKSYRYRVQVTDTAGNVSPWAISPTFVVSRVQESTAGIVYGGAWVAASSTKYSLGAAKYATAAGASVTYSFTGEGIAWVSAKSPARGSAQVLIDGVPVTTVNLFTSASTYQQLVFSTSWPTAGPHTIRIVVSGTAGHARVDLDTFVVAR